MKIVFFDLDGTILNDQKELPISTKKAINQLQKEGVHTVISTGRSPQMFDWIQKDLEITSYVSINGQYVVFENEEIHSNPLDEDGIDVFTKLATRNGHGLCYINHQGFKVNEANNQYIAMNFASLQMDYPAIDANFYKKRPVHQLHLYCQIGEEDSYIERFPEYSFVRWSDHAVDVLTKGSSKAIGTEKIIEQLNIKKDNSYAFGDGLNDIEMFRSVGTGIAMGNAVSELKEVADFVTTSNLEDGIKNGLIKQGLLKSNNR